MDHYRETANQERAIPALSYVEEFRRRKRPNLVLYIAVALLVFMAIGAIFIIW